MTKKKTKQQNSEEKEFGVQFMGQCDLGSLKTTEQMLLL
jgi:hypothetical protein